MRGKLWDGVIALVAVAGLGLGLWGILRGGPAVGVQGMTNLGSLALTDDLFVGDDVLAAGDLSLGDIGLVGNGTQLLLNDADQTVEMGSPDTGRLLRVEAASGVLNASSLTVTARRVISGQTADAILAASATGSITHNTAATGTVTISLPGASAGLNYCFYVGAAQTLAVDPATGDQIGSLTNAAGDKITNGTVGGSLCLVAADNTSWLPLGIVGTWADAN